MDCLPLECLCRGKRMDNEEWIEGYYMFKHNTNLNGPDNSKSFICVYRIIDRDRYEFIQYEVYPKSVGRIAMTPDLKRKAIFEGDIVNCKARSCCFERHIVVFDEGTSSFVITNGKTKHSMSKNFQYTVLGNIFDLYQKGE